MTHDLENAVMWYFVSLLQHLLNLSNSLFQPKSREELHILIQPVIKDWALMYNALIWMTDCDSVQLFRLLLLRGVFEI